MSEEQTTELVEQEKSPIELASKGMQLNNVDDMWRAAKMFANSGFCKPGLENSPSKIVVVLQGGAELGLLPWQSLQSLYVVNGRVGIEGSAMLGLIRRDKQCEYYKIHFEGEQFKDDFKAIFTSKRRDEPIEQTTEFSVADAKLAKLWGAKDNWSKYPKDMLTWRAVSRHGRLYYPDAIQGFYTEDELQQQLPAVPLMDAATAPGVQGLTKRIEAQTKAAEPETPSETLAEPTPPKTRARKKKLYDFFCPACGRTYQYGAKEGVGVACECGKSNIRRKPDVGSSAQAEEPPAPQEPVEAPSEQVPAPEAVHEESPPEELKWKCSRCERVMVDASDNGSCVYCFGEVTMLP